MAHNVQVKDKTITLKVTADQARAIEQCAKRCGVRKSTWIRSIVLQAASRQPSEGYLRIREPDGATT
jgi:uncharacterized protein (DUF1778 family)